MDSTLMEKLNYLDITQQQIFAALYDIGIRVPRDCTFRDVSRIISNIKTQGILQITEGVKFSLSDFSQLPQEMQVADGTSNVDQIFKNCTGSKAPKVFNYANIKSANESFYGCKELLKLDTFPSLTHIDRMFYGCLELKRINYLDFRNLQSMKDTFNGCDNLSYLYIYGLGTSDIQSYDFSPLVSWGDNTEVDSRNSLTRSLINDSYNRAQHNLPRVEIILSQMVKDRLGDHALNALNQKGYDIS